MTHVFLQDFAERKRQVRHYLAVVSQAEREIGIGTFSHVREGRLLTLRAGAFLVLYNLVEAATRGAIEAIHDKITTSEVPFTSLTISLRKEVVRLFKRGANPEKNHTMEDFPAAFVAIALAQGISLSGNVDAKLIRLLGDRYGFSCEIKTENTRNGSDLLIVKTNRNDLAHGRKAFEEVGRDYVSTDLLLIARRSMIFMDAILNNVGSYLDRELYLEKADA